MDNTLRTSIKYIGVEIGTALRLEDEDDFTVDEDAIEIGDDEFSDTKEALLEDGAIFFNSRYHETFEAFEPSPTGQLVGLKAANVFVLCYDTGDAYAFTFRDIAGFLEISPPEVNGYIQKFKIDVDWTTLFIPTRTH